MFIIYKTAVLSIVVIAIAVGLNTDTAHEKYKTEAFNFALWGDMHLTQKMVMVLKFKH